MSEKSIQYDFNVDTSRLIRAFEVSDDVGAIIRVHYELERALEHVLAKLFKNPKKLDANRVGPRLKRLEAIGLTGPTLALAMKIDEIRNAVAHRDQEELTEADIKSLEQISRDLSEGKFPTPTFSVTIGTHQGLYTELSLRRKFVIIGGVSISAIAVLPHLQNM